MISISLGLFRDKKLQKEVRAAYHHDPKFGPWVDEMAAGLAKQISAKSHEIAVDIILSQGITLSARILEKEQKANLIILDPDRVESSYSISPGMERLLKEVPGAFAEVFGEGTGELESTIHSILDRTDGVKRT